MNPDSTDRSRANEQARQAWDQNAEFWDLRMSEGNDFVDVLIWPCRGKTAGPATGGKGAGHRLRQWADFAADGRQDENSLVPSASGSPIVLLLRAPMSDSYVLR
jgi:hypothetical protein